MLCDLCVAASCSCFWCWSMTACRAACSRLTVPGLGGSCPSSALPWDPTRPVQYLADALACCCCSWKRASCSTKQQTAGLSKPDQLCSAFCLTNLALASLLIIALLFSERMHFASQWLTANWKAVSWSKAGHSHLQSAINCQSVAHLPTDTLIAGCMSG